MSPLTVVEAALTPIDDLRRWGLRLFGHHGTSLLTDRDRRVALVGAASVMAALGTTAVVPLWSLLLGPLLLGVPHLLADLRYLILRPRLHRRPGFLWLVALPLGATLIWPRLPIGLLAVAGACLLARAAWGLRLGAALLLLLVAAAVSRAGRSADIVFAHLHNLIAVALWWQWRPRRRALSWAPLAAFVVVSVAIVAGAVDGWAIRSGGLRPVLHNQVGVEAFLPTVSLFSDPLWGLRAVLFFAFAQSVHYAIWLRLVPDDDRPRSGLRSFRSSLRALRADCGVALLLGTLAATGLLLVAGAFDPYGARNTYLRLALFHGPLELAVVFLRVLERAPRAAIATTAQAVRA